MPLYSSIVIFLHSTLIVPTRFVFRLFMCEHTRSTFCNAGRKINWSTRIEAHMERATINFPVVFFCFSVSVSLYCLLAVGLEGPRFSARLANKTQKFRKNSQKLPGIEHSKYQFRLILWCHKLLEFQEFFGGFMTNLV